MMRSIDLISPRYREQQRVLHARPQGYGGKGHKWAPVVRALVTEYQAYSVLDYGCGQGSLVRALADPRLPGVRLDEYDPAIPGKDMLPSFADLVVCTDVLEHVEPELLASVLSHLRMLARKAVWLVVSTRETAKVLDDDRNAHLTVHPGTWWVARCLTAGFALRPVPAEARQRPDKEWMAVLTP